MSYSGLLHEDYKSMDESNKARKTLILDDIMQYSKSKISIKEAINVYDFMFENFDDILRVTLNNMDRNYISKRFKK
jgi:hypothetical protein